MLIDYAAGFANLFRSHTVSDNVNGAVALARTAQINDVALIVTHGQDTDGPGPIYPQLARSSATTRSCAGEASSTRSTTRRSPPRSRLFTALGALRRGYTVSVVVDASAGLTLEAHDAAVTRLTQLGVTPVTWLIQATEFQRSWINPVSAQRRGGYRCALCGVGQSAVRANTSSRS